MKQPYNFTFSTNVLVLYDLFELISLKTHQKTNTFYWHHKSHLPLSGIRNISRMHVLCLYLVYHHHYKPLYNYQHKCTTYTTLRSCNQFVRHLLLVDYITLLLVGGNCSCCSELSSGEVQQQKNTINKGVETNIVRNKFELADVNVQIHVWKFTPAITN